MTTLYIAEYERLAQAPEMTPQVAAEPPLAEQTVAIGGGSVQSAAFAARTRYVRIHTDSICSIAFGANPTATATNKRMAADQTEYFGVTPTQKVAVITNT